MFFECKKSKNLHVLNKNVQIFGSLLLLIIEQKRPLTEHGNDSSNEGHMGIVIPSLITQQADPQ
jgi:hypothetical protein